ncbi:MAG: YaiI/YqxD family protein [Candidatus Schekmanbacteria bacterium]|nr:YaiI/YqxD family protein [Candidatus Schekmanbacteria bacterium]
MTRILVDADGCPVKDEIYRVARRHGLPVVLVANVRMRTPPDSSISLVVVGKDLDAADDWIAGHATEADVVVADDVPLAARSLKKGAAVVGHRGRLFTDASIGDALATRDLLHHLREIGEVAGGPPPVVHRDRSRFLQRLEEAVRAKNPGVR